MTKLINQNNMKENNEYLITNFEKKFEQATTITTLQELLKRMKMQKIKWMADGVQNVPHFAAANPSYGGHSMLLLDEQTGLVEWELKKLRDAQSRGRFRAYYSFLKMLDEHYPYKTPLIRYKYILNEGVTNFKKEILSNMLHLLPDGRKPYLARIKYEMEELLNNVYASENTLDEWYINTILRRRKYLRRWHPLTGTGFMRY